MRRLSSAKCLFLGQYSFLVLTFFFFLKLSSVYRAAEFIIYRLKEMGKICEEDVATIMEQFEELDVDQSGTLSPSDILLAQSS